METTLITILVASCVISAVFVLTRIYFCYFAKRDCPGERSCDVVEPAKSPAYIEKPKRTPKSKVKAVVDEPVKKKPGRKKKQS